MQRLSTRALGIETMLVTCLLGGGCGGGSGKTNGADSGTLAGGAGSTGGAGGVDANHTGDAMGPAVDCSYLPCLASAVMTVAGCQPSDTCTSQTMTSGAVVHCFDNEVTIIVNNPMVGVVIIGVKQAGNTCYSVESDSTPALPNAATVEYRDGNNNTMVTIYTDDTGTHAECPGASGAFDIPPGSACMTAISALGGLTPGTACIHDSAGDCLY